MCRVLRVHRSGFYAWIKNPLSAMSKEDLRLLESIRTAYDESGGIYGSPPRVYNELREKGGERFKSGKPANAYANRLRGGIEVRE